MGTEKRARQKANRQARLQAAVAAQQRAKKKRQYLRIAVIGLLVVAVLAGFALWPRGSDDNAASGFAYGTGPCPTDPVSAPTKTFSSAPMRCIDPAKSYVAILDTTAGTIRAQLDTSRTPGTTNNFVTLARYLYYDNTQFFRTNSGIGIIQGGGTTYTPGDLVMARSSQPNSAGSQFFFTVNQNSASLGNEGTYVTFGKVTEGQDVLDKVLATNKPTNPSQPDEGKPDPPVTVTSVRIEES